jgi:sugar O-acyltransferase (sialic acid O-acetyltransferase NeuD family)
VLDKNIILIGYSGHGYVVVDVVLENQWNLVGYAEKEKLQYNPYNLNYIGYESNRNFFSNNNNQIEYVIGIGDNYIREKVFNSILDNNKKPLTLISPSSIISNSVKMGNGVFVNKNVIINTLVKIGVNVILNTACIIEHGCVIGDSVHISTGAVLAGNVTIGKRSFIGANSVIKQGVVIGEDVIVGAGTVVLSDVPSQKTIVGNPGHFI